MITRTQLSEVLNEKPLWETTGRSDYDLNPGMSPMGRAEGALIDAAVLMPIIERPSGLTMLFTLRAPDMPSHAGQVSFPGGRVDDTDHDAVHTALRETHEEVGIDPKFVTVAGFMDPYETRTGYAIMPVVGFVQEGFQIVPEEREVADVFEVPLSFLMNEDNHQTHSREWQGSMRHFYAMPYDDYYIWGATAGMIKALYDKVYAS